MLVDKHDIFHGKNSQKPREISSIPPIKNQPNLEEKTVAKDCSIESNETQFWQLWLQHESYLDRLCLSWMKGNRDRAEEALAKARIKAWEKWPKFAGKVTNPKAWLTQLTRNLCMDMHRESAKVAAGIVSLEQIIPEESSVFAGTASPESIILNRELDERIRSAVGALPSKLRAPFILRCYREMPYQEIADRLAISSASARKRVEQARSLLKQQLQSYVSGLDNSQLPKQNYPSDKAAIEQDAEIDCHYVQKNQKQMHYPKSPTARIKMMNSSGNSELINYRITAICLDILPHTWYSLPSLMG